MPRIRIARRGDQRLRRRTSSKSERSLAIFVACTAVLAIGGGGWAVSGHSQDAHGIEHVASNITVSPGLSLSIDNPFASWPTEPEHVVGASDNASATARPSAGSRPKSTVPLGQHSVVQELMDDSKRGGESADDDVNDFGEETFEGEMALLYTPPIYRLPPVTPIADGLASLGEITSLPAEDSEQNIVPVTPMADSDRGRFTTETPRAQRILENGVNSVAAPPMVALPPAGTSIIPVQSLPYTPQLADTYLYTPSSAELTTQLLPAIQHACGLAQRGAVYAAQAEFIQAIRRVAQANDAECGTDQHSRALAEGLRALDEATDFVPDGTGLEGELDVRIAASSHRTPVVRQSRINVAPHTAVALYHSLAQERLAAAVGGQQAGSMALYGLGKTHARLAERNNDDILSMRSAMTMYAAAVAACPANHLAANELGVLLCRNGHPAEAARLFERSIDFAPNATTYHNLAVAQQRLGMTGPAVANQQEADRLAAWERSTGAVSRRAGVQWVSPNEMSQVASPPVPAMPVADNGVPGAMPVGQNAPAPIPNTAPPAVPKSPWQKATEIAKSLPLPGGGDKNRSPAAPGPRVLTPGSPHTTPITPWR